MTEPSHRFHRERNSSEFWIALVDLTEKFPTVARLWEKIDPFYAFHSSVFDSKSIKELFTEDHLAAESAYATLCERFEYIGIHSALPITSMEFSSPSWSKIQNDARKLGVVKSLKLNELQWNQHDKTRSSTYIRTLGYLGYLYSDPIFLKELNSVRSFYDQLGVPLPLPFPLPRPIVLEDHCELFCFPLRSFTNPDRADQFNRQLLNLMSKWELLEFKTWNIPIPQGPLLDNPLPPGSIASSQLAAQMAVPAHFQLKDSDKVIKKISHAQNQSNPHMTSIRKAISSHADQYAQMARMMHLERVFRSRFPDGMPRGYSNVLLDMACQYLGFVKPASAKRIRNWIKKCQAGNRNSIPGLC